jgi:very-short-patch-repair endonuclease
MKLPGAWKSDGNLWEKLKPHARQHRREPTKAERVLWDRLRSRQISGFRFRRQHTIERYIVDFYCAEKDLVVEVDGSIHELTPEQDAIRQEFLESLGLRVIRFENNQILFDLQQVMSKIEQALRR